MIRPANKLVILLALGLVLATALPAAASGGSTVGTLHLASGLAITWHKTACPTGTPSTGLCFAVQGQGVVPGLGQATELYTYVADDAYTPGSTTVHFTAAIKIADKGEIDASGVVQEHFCGCEALATRFAFTVSGGTGAYAGAQGSGSVIDDRWGTGKGAGKDTWSGTLMVPGYTFDTQRPTIKGALPKVVKAPAAAKLVRVTYKVTARDPDEGSLPTICKPRSGSRFKLGPTTVRCTATDANGNTAKASFQVRVKRTM
jgi:hypothetical protein